MWGNWTENQRICEVVEENQKHKKWNRKSRGYWGNQTSWPLWRVSSILCGWIPFLYELHRLGCPGSDPSCLNPGHQSIESFQNSMI